jgi:RHH-type proline utilization regulon transcriptional repressor/proline dehydrogenase/delta 1-pyrroline-5-carboxylate dehydrogenase
MLERKEKLLTEKRLDISKAALMDEKSCVESLLPLAKSFQTNRDAIYKRAKRYVKIIRKADSSIGVEQFIKEYGLDNQEGVMIMCLAEALLRIPDDRTADALIRDKIDASNWESHLKQGQPLLINAATWGLLLTGKVISAPETDTITGSLHHLIKRMGEPVIRKAIASAMHLMGKHFVMGQTIEQAISHSKKMQKQGYLFSFDMLGEAALTKEHSDEFFDSYMHAISAAGKHTDRAQSINHNMGISVKLSALHPRYEALQKERVMDELLPRVKELLLHAKNNHMAVAIDAEEANRLDISLELFTALISDKDFDGYDGVGFVVQAYGKRAIHIIRYLIELSEKYTKNIPIRLVKGAYWDSEIKWAQEKGLVGYPVFTRKSFTDLSYFACAQILLENTEHVYPQFATHNALTVAGILEISDTLNISDELFEFQRLYGMGDDFYNQMSEKRKIRVYAPVGSYQELLPYLIRRMLENGANSSFINMLMDENEPLKNLLRNPVNKTEERECKPNENIPLPKDMYGVRQNSAGQELGLTHERVNLQEAIATFDDINWKSHSIIDGVDTDVSDVGHIFKIAKNAFTPWNETKIERRATILYEIADSVEANKQELIALLINEAGKTVQDAIDEIRETVDFCRYYALRGESDLAPITLQGPTGELNQLTNEGKGVFVCISPWNFPLAIFAGQIVAALMAGNSVIAKPAAQTTEIATLAVKLMHKAGIPAGVLNLVLGEGSSVGNALTAHADCAGVAFTGSTGVAKIIESNLAKASAGITPLIAETGGQNCMIVDSSALLEQATQDIIQSAFGSAGQRCSALRVLYVQKDIAERLTELLKGATAELTIGNPSNFNTDVGPVIDKLAAKTLQAHIDKMTKEHTLLAKAKISDQTENIIAPHIFAINTIGDLEQEVFGPILHIITYDANDLEEVIEQINSTGFGLTCGVHSRIESRIRKIKQGVRAGNIYINRSMTGATVGVQPFGGVGLSGTGPKAGGPQYLHAFSNEKTITTNTAAIGGDITLLS